MTDALKIKAAVASLAGKPTQNKTLATRETPAALPATIGTGSMRLNGSAQGGAASGGIAGPLTELDAEERTYHATKTLLSTDGFFALQVQPVASLTLTDAAGRTVVINLDNPPA